MVIHQPEHDTRWPACHRSYDTYHDYGLWGLTSVTVCVSDPIATYIPSQANRHHTYSFSKAFTTLYMQ